MYRIARSIACQLRTNGLHEPTYWTQLAQLLLQSKQTSASPAMARPACRSQSREQPPLLPNLR